jgi:hypothetical protein
MNFTLEENELLSVAIRCLIIQQISLALNRISAPSGDLDGILQNVLRSKPGIQRNNRQTLIARRAVAAI